jgi:hypothetical protein
MFLLKRTPIAIAAVENDKAVRDDQSKPEPNLSRLWQANKDYGLLPHRDKRAQTLLELAYQLQQYQLRQLFAGRRDLRRRTNNEGGAGRLPGKG